ncbi:MAG: ABC transporter substrate-binding protein [Myxococcota bacterium]
MRVPTLALLILLLLLPSTSWAARVAVVADDDLTVYRSVITGFSIEARAEIDEYNLRGDAKLGERIVAEIAQRKPDVLLAVGPKSANLLRQKFPKTPLVHCMVPNVASYDLSGPNVTGVALEPAVKEQFAVLKTLVPGAKKVGLVYDPRHSGPKVREAEAAASAAGLTLVTAEVSKPEDIAGALKGMTGNVDALWTTADSTVLTVVGLDAMGEFSRQNKVPVYGINANHVQRGALMTLALDYPRVGRQAGKLANRLLADPEAARTLQLQPPEGLDLALNLSVARRLGVEAPAGAAALELAADRRYAVQVFK